MPFLFECQGLLKHHLAVLLSPLFCVDYTLKCLIRHTSSFLSLMSLQLNSQHFLWATQELNDCEGTKTHFFPGFTF